MTPKVVSRHLKVVSHPHLISSHPHLHPHLHPHPHIFFKFQVKAVFRLLIQPEGRTENLPVTYNPFMLAAHFQYTIYIYVS